MSSGSQIGLKDLNLLSLFKKKKKYRAILESANC